MAKWWKRRVFNYMRQVYIDPCDPNRHVYAQLAADAALAAFISYATPGWKDEVDLVTGKSWIKHAAGRLKEARRATPTWLSETGEILLSLGEAIDRILWLVMVAELLFDTFISWGSAAYQVDPCDEETDYIWWRSKRPAQFESRFSEWVQGPSWSTDAGNVGPSFASDTVIPANWKGYVCWGAKYAKFLGFGEVIKYQTRTIDETGKVLSQQSYTVHEGNQNKGPLQFHVVHPHPTDRHIYFQVWVEATDHFMDWYAFQGYAAGALYDSRLRHKDGQFYKSGYTKSTLSVTDTL